jgi:aminoglycoside phosphotransferase (APT) family kinase protein
MNDYIKSLQEKMTTPDGVIESAIRDNLQSSVESKQRIFAGEDNEVYDTLLKNGQNVIVRISRKGPIEFRKESWAMGQCKKVGVPVAEVLFIQDVELDEKTVSISAQSKIAGDSLERGNTDYRTLDRSVLKNLIVQSGAMLSRIHSVRTNGFGKLNEDGRGPYKNIKEWIEAKLSDSALYFSLAETYFFDKSVLEKALQILENFSKESREISPVLNHGDFVPKHFFFKGDKITGIIDFGGIKGNSPMHDFAIWDYWIKDEFPIEWLKEGYENKELFNEEFDLLLTVFKIDLAFYLIKLYHERNYPEGILDGFSKMKSFVETVLL